MTRIIAAAPVVFVALVSCRGARLTDPAPYDARNQHPVQLTAGRLGARAPTAVPAGGGDLVLKLDWTNLWLLEGFGADRVQTDGELLRFAPRLRLGLGHDLDLAVEVPFVHASGGALDKLIDLWHEIGGFPQADRDQFPRNRFRVRFDRRLPNNTLSPAYEMEPHGLRLGDVPIELGWFPIDENGWQAGLRAGVELPVGDEAAGFGNGKLDTMLGVAAGWHEEVFAWFGWLSWAHVGTASRARDVGIDYPDVLSAGLGGEVAFSASVSGLAQVEWERSLLSELDETHANRSHGFIWLGARVSLTERTGLELALGEDVIQGLSPDVTFHIALRVRW